MARRFFFGTSNNDTYFGYNGSEVIFTGSGNDYIDTRGGNDLIFAGNGNDYVRAGSGNDVVFAGSGNDVVFGQWGNDTVYGGSGNDWLFGGSGHDRLFGGSGNDYIGGGRGVDLLVGGSGNDRLRGDSGNDRVYGESGNDSLYGGSGNDDLVGGSGNDRLFGGSGRDDIFGGTGNDLLVGGSGNDLMVGGAGGDRLFGQYGNDTFNLTLSEETGAADYIAGGSGIDTLVLNLTVDEFASQDVADDLISLLDYIDANMRADGQVWGRALTLDALNLRVEDVETLIVRVDGVDVEPRDAGPDTGGDVDPVAVDDTFVASENASLDGDVTANDTTNAGTTVTLISGVSQGTLVLNADGRFSFDAGDDFDALADGETVDVSFSYELSGGGETRTATATITVTGSNDAPVVSSPLVGAASENGEAISLDLLAGASDVDSAELSIANISGVPAGAFVTIDGATLTLDPAGADFEALAAGETQTFTISYDVIDGDGAAAAQTVTLTITGTNDAPTASAQISAEALTDTGILSLNLLDGAADIDGDTLSVVSVSELPAGVVLTDNTLSVDTADPAFDALADGETAVFTVIYDVSDGQGGAAARTATLTVTGTNEAPVITGAITAAVTEDSGIQAVDLLAGASDADGDTLTVLNVSALPAGVTLDGTALSVNTDAQDFQSLGEGQAQTIIVTYDITDGNSVPIAQTATLTITGTNDAPTIAAALIANADEGGEIVGLDPLGGAADADIDTSLSVVLPAQLPAGVSFIDGTLLLDPRDAAYNSLDAGDTIDIAVEYTITDGEGGSVAQTATFTVTGTNDAPTVTGALSASADEDSESFTIDLLDGASDVDAGAVLSVTDVTGLQAGVTLDAATLTVDPSDAAFQSLAQGEVQTIDITYEVADQSGGSVSQTATITITGTNDTPVVTAALSASAFEDDEAPVTLDLLAGASDADNGAVLSIANVSGLTSAVTLDGTALSLNPADASLQALVQDETLDIVVTYDVVDQFGAAAAQTATFTVTGTNDVPVVSAALTATATEDGASVTVDLLGGASDVDAGAVLSVAGLPEGLPEGVSIDGATLSFDPSAQAYQALALGETLDVVVEYRVQDENGASTPQSVTLTITGTNDVPTVESAIELSITEGRLAFAASALQGASDVDNGAVLSVANLSELPAGVQFDSSVNRFVVDPGNSAFDDLALDEVRELTVTFDIVDENGASAAQSLILTVTGTNDAPAVGAALRAVTQEDSTAVTLDLLEGASDVDNGAVLSVAGLPEVLPEGMTVTGALLTFDPSDAAYQSLAQDETIDITLNYTVADENDAQTAQSATITITGTNDTPVVEAALSAGLTEGTGSTNFDLLAGASDVDNGADLSVVPMTPASLPAGVIVVSSTLLFNTNSAAYNDLAAGEMRDVTVDYVITDGLGGDVAQTLTLTVTGTNDAPTVEGVITSTQSEDANIFRVDLLEGASDVDNGAVLSASFIDVTLPDGFSVDESTNELIVWAANNDDIQALADGETLDITVNYGVTDEQGGVTAQSVVLTFTGANDAPRVTRNTPLQELPFDTAYSFTLPDDTFTDIDNGDSISLSATLADGGEIPRWLSFDAATGTFSGTPTAADGGGVFVTVTATDQSGATRSTNVTFAVGDGVILGTDGDDNLLGTPNADTFFGGEGNDTMSGLGGNDTYVINIGDGQDSIDDTGFNGIDTVIFAGRTLGEATFSRDELSDTVTVIFANGDSVELIEALDPSFGDIERVVFEDATLDQAAFAAVVLQSQTTTGNDVLFGSSLSDVFEGGLGDDEMVGAAGNDTYVFNEGDGNDTVDDRGFNGTDTLQFNGRDLADATFTREGTTDTILISFDNGDSVRVIEGIDPSFGDIEQVIFDDITLDAEGLRNAVLAQVQTDGDDIINGTQFADTIEGGLGNDQMFGGAGNDTYVFNIGDGQDIVDDGGFNGIDTVQFNGRNFADATITRDGNSDTVTFTFTNGDSVEVIEALDNSFGDIEQVIFDDITLDTAAFKEAVIAAYTTEGDDVIFGTSVADVITGGLGNDTMEGGGGNDTYIFNIGDGQDIVDDNGLNGTDTLQFNGRNSGDATFTRIGNSETITISFDNGDSVEVIEALDRSFGDIEQIIFDDVTLGETELRQAVIESQQTDGDDTIFGFRFAETYEGGLGDDTIFGGSGIDTYIFNAGDGNDTIEDNGNAGQPDTLRFTQYDLAQAAFTDAGSGDLLIEFQSGDSVRVVNGLSSRFDRIESFEFQDQTITFEDIEAIIAAFDGTSGDDVITGQFVSDRLAGGEGNDTVNGLAGDDVINGDSGNDTLTGGLGNDLIFGGTGDDVFLFDAGDGNDLISETLGNDTINFGSLSSADAQFSATPGGILIEFTSGDSVEISVSTLDNDGGPGPETNGVETYIFADQTLTYDEIIDIIFPVVEGITVEGTSEDEDLFGTTGDDTIIGLAGDDNLFGGLGSDTYIYNLNDGADQIIDTGGANDSVTLLGYSREDAFTLFAVGIDGDGGGPVLILPSLPDSNEFNEIFLSDSEIEFFTFIPDAGNPDNFETFTFDELFGDGPFGPGGPGPVFDGEFGPQV